MQWWILAIIWIYVLAVLPLRPSEILFFQAIFLHGLTVIAITYFKFYFINHKCFMSIT